MKNNMIKKLSIVKTTVCNLEMNRIKGGTLHTMEENCLSVIDGCPTVWIHCTVDDDRNRDADCAGLR